MFLSPLDELILQLVRNKAIQDQSQFTELLAEHGQEVTQSTLSRKLKNLNIEKKNGRYRLPDDENTSMLEKKRVSLVREVRPCPPNLIVLVPPPFESIKLGHILRQKNLEGVLAIIAGEQEVLLAVKEQFYSRLLQDLGDIYE